MNWNDGLGHDGTRILLPVCGITYGNIRDAAYEHKTIPATARRLGVGETTLRRCVADYGMSHYFEERQEPRCPTKITPRRLSYWLRQGMTRKDMAEAMGVSYCHLNSVIRRQGLHTQLPNRGAAAWLARRGYAGADSVGKTPEGRFAWA